MPNAATLEHYLPLKQVTTVTDAAQRWGYHPATIRYGIDAGNIAALKVGGVWLVSVPSMRAYYGSEIKDNILLKTG